MEVTLTSPVQYIPRVGPRMATLLRKLGISTVFDLITYVPFRYKDYSLVSPISKLQPGETVTVVGSLEYIRTFVTKNGKRLVMGKLRDATGTIEVTWFNQIYLTKTLHPGDLLSASGKIEWFGQKIVLSAPEYEVLKSDGDRHEQLHTGRLVPVYPETDGLSSKWLRGRIAHVLPTALSLIVDDLPEDIRSTEHLPTLPDAIREVHFPSSLAAAEKARERLAFDEIFLLLLRSHQQKLLWQSTRNAPPLPETAVSQKKFHSALPFALTPDQTAAIAAIASDIAKPIPMNRLLEGDVGAGKTVVAAYALYLSVLNGKSAALLAPTQILAQQHADTLEKILTKKLGINVHLIVGGQKKLQKTDLSVPAVYIGTHALLSESLPLPEFGIIVIDEQQRFGVNQRAALRKGNRGNTVPHQLIMTATPIPRTIAQTVFGNLDVSVLRALPSGRKPVKTWVVPTGKRAAAYQWMKTELTNTRSQAFVICPLIDDSETLTTVRAVKSEFEKLTAVFAPLRVNMLHGRMKTEEKNAALSRLHDGKDDVLVATPVVEVGIDIPEATIIVIEAAERFGLSQLHQLRGRVGRREKPSYCLLFTENETPEVLTRLKALETVHNGPELAELDLTLRGPGELFGTRQHGVPGFAIASLSDASLISRVKNAVSGLTKRDPTLARFPHLREMLNESKIDTIDS